MTRGLCFVAICTVACGGTQRATTGPGGANDEGAGELAKQSIQLAIGPDGAEVAETPENRRAGLGGDSYGGDPYGGGGYGGDPYGGATYANWSVPQWSYSTPNRTAHYNIGNVVDGTLEGTVTWTGAAPPKLATACGAIENPTVRVGSDRGTRGVLVYIEKVTVGRQLPYYSRPAAVGGVVTKHGCALLPSAQVVTPLPTALSVYGDGARARIRIAAGNAAPKAYELQEAGLVQLEVQPGLTRVDGEDGKLVAAWVLALETPYYSVTDDRGRYRIDQLAPGTYDVTFWQAPIASAAPDGALVYGAPIVVHRTVKIDSRRTARLDLALPAH
jgi:hypothetical protein